MDNQLNDLIEANMTIMAEWSAPGNISLEDYKLLAIMADTFALRAEHDEAVVNAMIDNGVDPEVAWNRAENWKIWVLGCLFAAYNIGRGEKSTSDVRVFSEYINNNMVFKDEG